jgi:hypothetical protein
MLKKNETGYKVWGHIYDPEKYLRGGLVNSAEYACRDWRFVRMFFDTKEHMEEWLKNPVYVLGAMF